MTHQEVSANHKKWAHFAATAAIMICSATTTSAAPRISGRSPPSYPSFQKPAVSVRSGVNVSLNDLRAAQSPNEKVVVPGRPRGGPTDIDEPPRKLSSRGLKNLCAFAELFGLVRYFHPTDNVAGVDWDSFALIGVQHVESARSSGDLRARLESLFRPLGSSIEIVEGNPTKLRQMTPTVRPVRGSQAVRWQHVGLGNGVSYASARVQVSGVASRDYIAMNLGSGVSARVPMVLWRDDEGQIFDEGIGEIPQLRKPASFIPAGFDRTTRLAAVIKAWSTLQHSYPYFNVVDVDWRRQLGQALRDASSDRDDREFEQSLRRMLATLRDGHAHVTYSPRYNGILPLAWEEIEGQLVVTAIGRDVPGILPGDIVTHIGGRTVEQVLRGLQGLASGSKQWKQHVARMEARFGETDREIELRVRRDGVARKASIAYRPQGPDNFLTTPRPNPIAVVAPGIIYVDLTRVTDTEMDRNASYLSSAKGIVFDTRGYPKVGTGFLTRIARYPFRSALFELATYLRPEQEEASFDDRGWHMLPKSPSWTTNVLFVTDGTAISYAESILGLVRANQLGDIVGEPTAGANGNMAREDLPGGYQISWTGMRVRNVDGSQHHVRGVLPTVPVSRTLAGFRSGRDEMLETAVQLAQRRVPSSSKPGR